jgi:hypothetical protein
MQTTVNDIASLFMGNPGALQNRIQKEQQAKPGIPPDLKELLALQQINEQIQASQQQQALQNPQNQPTVAQSLQQRAKQALMARQVQAQQMQMARAGQMGLPQGLPQPQHQPQMGLDQIQSNLGEYYGGGIVAFDGTEGSQVKDKYETPYDRMNRLNREAEAAEEARLKTPEGRAEQIRKDRLAMLNLPAAAADIVGGPLNYLAQTGESIANKIGIPRLGRALGIYDPDVTSVGIPRIGSGSNTPYTDMLRSANKAPVESEKATQQSETPYDASTATRREDFKEALQKPPAPRPRPTEIAASPRVNPPTQQPELAGPPIEAMNPPMSQVQSDLAKISNMDPAEIERQRRQQYESEVGKPQFAEERELIKELQARRANIGKGTNPLLDLLEGIATSAPGRGGVLSQGAEGVRNARAMQAQREQQNMDMLKEILGQQKTITAGERAYKENLFSLGKKVYDETFAHRFEALKAQGMDEREARRLASEEARAKERLIVEREQIASQERRHKETIAAGREPSFDTQLFLKDPETYGKMMAAKNPAAANRGQMDRDKAEDNFRKDMENPMIASEYRREATEVLKKQGIQNPTISDIKEYFIQKMMKGSPYAPKEGAVNPGNRAPLSSFQR